MLDAFFTATSAICVTGLTVVDTGTRFSPFGQAVVLGLIQVGGLGLMTFAVFVGVALGRVAFTERMVIQESMHHTPRAGVRRLVRYVLAFTLASEAVGALWLWLRLREELPTGRRSGPRVFHSVSAFCNAGFSPAPRQPGALPGRPRWSTSGSRGSSSWAGSASSRTWSCGTSSGRGCGAAARRGSRCTRGWFWW